MTVLTLTTRGYAGEADLPAIVELINACEAVDQVGWGQSVEELGNELGEPGVDHEKDIRIWLDDQGQMVAYADVFPNEDEEFFTGQSFFVVRPELRGMGIEEQVLDWAAARTREKAAEHNLAPQMKFFCDNKDSWRMGLFTPHGEPDRYFWRMKRDLSQPIPAPQIPAGYTIRAVREDELEAWADVYNNSFIDHYDFHPMTIERARNFTIENPGFSPERSLVAEAPDGTLAAFCLAIISKEEIEREGLKLGWIRLLGTRRGHRGVGLGRAILLSGMQKLRDEGMEEARLGVDTSSPTGATRLYDSTGFTPYQTFPEWKVKI